MSTEFSVSCQASLRASAKNAGGVTVSYFEWAQNLQGWSWELDEIHNRLDSMMPDTVSTVWDFAEENDLSLRGAAYATAVRRISEAIEAHGTRDYFGRQVELSPSSALGLLQGPAFTHPVTVSIYPLPGVLPEGWTGPRMS